MVSIEGMLYKAKKTGKHTGKNYGQSQSDTHTQQLITFTKIHKNERHWEQHAAETFKTALRML